jgi:hypothetical protein
MSRLKEPGEERTMLPPSAPTKRDRLELGSPGSILALQRTAGNRAVGALVGRRKLQRDGTGPKDKVVEPKPEYEPLIYVERLDRRRFKVRYGKDVLGTVEIEGATGEQPGRLATFLSQRMQFLDKTGTSPETQRTIDLEVRHDPSLELRWRPDKGFDGAVKRLGMTFAFRPVPGKPPFPHDRELEAWPRPTRKPRVKLPPGPELDPLPRFEPRDRPSDEPATVVRDVDEPEEIDWEAVEKTITTVVDIGTDFVPGVSNVKDFHTAVTGVNPVNGEKVGLFGRILALLFSIPGFGNVLKYIGKGFKVLGRALLKLGRLLGRPLKALGRWGAKEADRAWRWLKGALDRVRRARAAAARRKLEREADEAIAGVRKGAKPAAKTALRAIDAVIRMVLERLRDWAAGVFRQGEFRHVWFEFEGGDVVIYGQGSKIRIVRIRISAVKEYAVEKTEKLLGMLTDRSKLLARMRKETDDAAWAMLRKKAIDVTEDVGEHVGQMLVKRHFPGATLLYRGAGANTVDLVFRHKGRLIVCETKGHFSRLAFREIGPDVLAQQGTLTYLDGTIRKMLNSSDKGTRELAAELAAGRKAGTVEYVVTKTGSLNTTGDSLAATLSTIVQ